jgi:hypothetical protein
MDRGRGRSHGSGIMGCRCRPKATKAGPVDTPKTQAVAVAVAGPREASPQPGELGLGHCLDKRDDARWQQAPI